MNTAILLLLVVISISGNESSSHLCSSEPDDRCPTLSALDCLNFRILASSTCGDNNSSSQYCYGSSPRIQCSACENEDFDVRNAVDLNSSTHWISRPGLEAANLTVDLIQPIRVTVLILSTSRSLSSKLPTQWEIHRSIDNGISYMPWIYLATSSSPCPDGIKNDGEPNEDEVACHDISKDDSNVVAISLANNRNLPMCGANTSFVYATNVRLVFLATDTEEVVNSSQILAINGYCDCNGYATQCLIDNVTRLYQCDCLNGTCGRYCEQCCPLFNNALYAAYKTGCEECNCSGNAESCEYNETLGMGVCISCKNNTTGINCEQCLPQYYLDSMSGSCLPCQCNENGTVDDGQCNELGQCNCKEGYTVGLKCDHCPNGTFHNEGSCNDCLCPTNSSSGVRLSCDPFSGQCACPPNTIGLRCDMCADDTWDLDTDFGCKPCSCDALGAIGTDCNISTGQCSCRDGYTGIDCSQCEDTYYRTGGICVPCNCHTDGSQNLNCNSTTGKCTCKEHVEGQRCDQCEEGFYSLTGENGCLSCSCDDIGSTSRICDKVTGQCDCLPGKAGRICVGCKTGYYIDTLTTLCLLCECSENGSTSNACNEEGHCDCKEGVTGDKCDMCASGYWGFTGDGCKECDCFYDGTDKVHICNNINGQCICAEGISGPRCTQCEGMGHFIIENGTCNACGGCSENLIDDLLLLVDQIQAAIDFLSNKDNVVPNANRLNQLRNKAMLIIGEVMEWSDTVNVSLCKLGIDAYCKPIMEMPSILRNSTRLSELIEELRSYFPKLTDDVDDVVKLTNQTFIAFSMFETNVTVANDDTKAILDKATEVLSEVTERLKNVEQLLNDSEAVLVTVIERNADFYNVNSTVNMALDDVKMRDSNSRSFLHNRTMESISVNNISNHLEMLQTILQDIHSVSVNVSTTVNNTVIYNRNLDSNITRLQVILNTTAMLNETIATRLNETWEAYTDVYAMWEEAELLLENVSDIINLLNLTTIPCATNETESFESELDNVTDLVARAHNHSTNLVTNSSFIINESTFWLQHGEQILTEVSTLLSSINFTMIHLDIQTAITAAQDAIKQINEADLPSLEMKASQLNNKSNLLSQQVAALSAEIKRRKDEAEIIHNNRIKFVDRAMKTFTDVTTFQNQITKLNERVEKIVFNYITSRLSESEDLVNRSMTIASQISNKSLNVEANINVTETNMQLTNSDIEKINEIDVSLTTLGINISSSIDNFTVDVDDLINKTKKMTSEIDDIIKGLSDIHQEINQINKALYLTAEDGKESFISLQPPPGRALTGATQYETIDLFLEPDPVKNNTLLFYAGPAKAKDNENDEIFQQSDYMALLLQTTFDDDTVDDETTLVKRNELVLVYKLSEDADAQRIILNGSDFTEAVTNHVHISRVGSTFKLALNRPNLIQQDSLSFTDRSLIFTGNNQTAFYIGGKPQDVELPGLVNSTSHYSGIVWLLLYNGQLWSLWDIRDSFNVSLANRNLGSNLISALFDQAFSLSFTGDGYLFTESLFSEQPSDRSGIFLTIKITVKPFSTEGLVMFAYDEQDNASLEIYYSMGYLNVVLNGDHSQRRSIKSEPGKSIDVEISKILSPTESLVIVRFASSTQFMEIRSSAFFTNFTRTKSWFGGIKDGSRHLEVAQTKPFFGCIELALQSRGIDLDQDHFIKHYVNSSIQNRLSLDCLSVQFAHSVSFDGSGRIKFDATSFPDDIIIENNDHETFNSFSFEFAASEPNAGLLYARTETSSLSIVLLNSSINVILCDQNNNKIYLNSSRQLELGTLHFLLLYLNYVETINAYQLFIDDFLEVANNSFENKWRLDLFKSTELYLPEIFLGTGDDKETSQYFKGCMKNFAIQFKIIGFLSPESFNSRGITYHKCDIVESSREPPVLAVAAAEPVLDKCPSAMMNFTTLNGIQSCHFPELTDEYNYTIQAIPERPNGLLLALGNNSDLLYAIGTREGKGLYYANNMTEEFSSDCPSLITVDIVSRSNIIMISGSSSINITQSGPLSLYIGGLPKDAITDDRISFLQCNECEHPPGFLGQLDIREIDLDHLVNSNKHKICRPNTQ